MTVVIGIMAYLAIAAAQTAVLEKIFEGEYDEYDEYFNWPFWVSLVWPLTAPFLLVKYAVAKLLEQVGDKK